MNEFDRVNNDYWTWGIIYNNPNDPDIWVKKRYGLGWTLNFAHSRSYSILGLILLFIFAIGILAIVTDKG